MYMYMYMYACVFICIYIARWLSQNGVFSSSQSITSYQRGEPHFTVPYRGACVEPSVHSPGGALQTKEVDHLEFLMITKPTCFNHPLWWTATKLWKDPPFRQGKFLWPFSIATRMLNYQSAPGILRDDLYLRWTSWLPGSERWKP